MQARAQKTVAAIIKAAIQLLESHGEKGLVTNRVAERSGFSIGTLYQYFPNKKQLIFAIAAGGQQMILKQLKQQLDEFEKTPNVKDTNSMEIIQSILRLLIDGFCYGKKSNDANHYSRIVIRLAWTWEQPENNLNFINEVATRIIVFIETINHPDLPPLSTGQYFVLIRSVMGTLRYASLENSTPPARAELEETLNLMVWRYFQLNRRGTHDIKPHQGGSYDTSFFDLSKAATQKDNEEVNSDFLRRTPVQGRAKHTIVTIFKAALQMLGQEGDGGLTAQKIAKRSGFSVGTFYQYFSNKETLVRTMAGHGQNLIFHQFDKCLQAMENYPDIAHVDADILVGEIIAIYVNGISQGNLLPKSKYVGKLLIRLCWSLENVTDTIQMAERVTTRIHEAIKKLDHPSLPIPNAMTLFVVSRSLLGTLRSASMEESPLLSSPLLVSSLTQMGIALLVVDPP